MYLFFEKIKKRNKMPAYLNIKYIFAVPKRRCIYQHLKVSSFGKFVLLNTD
tara:strand:- start:6407 stop:6559 length:153 start_codon:yes stop_codon:yes gene_type:complete